LYGGGLTTLAIATATGALVQRWLLLRFVRFRHPDIVKARGQWRLEVARSMVPMCLRVWLTSLGYLLVANTDQLFIASKEGTTAIPAYRAAFILVINLHLISGVFSGASPIFVSQLWQAGENGKIRTILRRNAQIGLLCMGCGTAAILVLGPNLFEAWLGPGNFVGYPVLMTFLATFLLEHHANVFSTCGRATNDEAYSAWSIGAGILKLALAFALTPLFGLCGLAVSTLLAQGLTTDWFMVYRSAKRLGVKTIDHVREVLLPCLLVFVLCLFGSKVADTLLQGHHTGIRVPIVSGVAGLILLAALWRIILNEPQRYELLRGRMLFRARRIRVIQPDV
jgi:O-antigen/teichoic acid export membrane protein